MCHRKAANQKQNEMKQVLGLSNLNPPVSEFSSLATEFFFDFYKIANVSAKYC